MVQVAVFKLEHQIQVSFFLMGWQQNPPEAGSPTFWEDFLIRMPWLWMSVFGSTLKFDHLTQTKLFGKELSLFLFEHLYIYINYLYSLSLNIYILLCDWKRVLQWGLSMGILRMRVMESLKVSSEDAEGKWKLSLGPVASMWSEILHSLDLSILCLLFAHRIGLQPLPGEASSSWFAGGGWQICLSLHPCLPLSGCWNLTGINMRHHISSPWMVAEDFHLLPYV